MATLQDILTADDRVREADPALWEKLDRFGSANALSDALRVTAYTNGPNY